jgi:superfamily II DNA or RNA helicase
MDPIDSELHHLQQKLAALHAEQQHIQARMNLLLREKQRTESTPPVAVKTASSIYSPQDKIAIFRRLFKGRTDVYPKRFESRKTGRSGYQPACANEWKYGLCDKRNVKCAQCPNRVFLPVTDDVIEKHLRGLDELGNDFIIGVYPMLENEHCHFLAVDFDKKNYIEDAKAFLETCQKYNVPAALERSRSGNGAHLWIFFTEAVSAHIARQMGSFLLTETMEQRPELGFESYDRFFPNQDTMPSGGLGNLIALPLQAKPRKLGNSVFLDDQFQPYADQWSFLENISLMMPSMVEALAAKAVQTGRITGVKMPELEENEKPWEQPPSRRRKPQGLNVGLKQAVEIVIENEIYFTKSQLTPKLQTALLRLAAFQNPEFYRAQAMRMPIYDKPRIIGCAEVFPEHIGLPRGCAEDLTHLLLDNHIPYTVCDKRNSGSYQSFTFQGNLRDEQEKAALALLKYDLGVLSASTAFGKTVVAIYLIAQRSVNTLVLVHRVQLIEQWKSRLQTFLGIPPDQIGTIGGGKKRVTNIVDIASIQSLIRAGVVDDVVGNYGMVVVDECHHLSAFTFESVIRQCKCKYVLGLSATLTRKDGHHPIIFMQCGPVRYRVNEKQQALERPFDHQVIVRETHLELNAELAGREKPTIHDIYERLLHDEERNRMIIDDVRAALKAGRNPVVITERKEHLAWLAGQFQDIPNLFVMQGGMRRKMRLEIQHAFSTVPEDEQRLLLATGKFLGEGFDDPRLDTLFLTMPISWRGTLAQYAGRLHRLYDRKKEVMIYDYADTKIPMTARMFDRRKAGYKSIGYRLESQCQIPGRISFFNNEKTRIGTKIL